MTKTSVDLLDPTLISSTLRDSSAACLPQAQVNKLVYYENRLFVLKFDSKGQNT